jgi:hypothetical protein
VKRFFPERREDLYVTYADLIPDAQGPTPGIEFGKMELDRKSGNQTEDYLELLNLEETAVDLSGWKLDGPVRFTFKEGTVIAGEDKVLPGANRLYVTSDVNAFRRRGRSPKGGESHFVQGPFKRRSSKSGDPLVLKDRHGKVIVTTTRNEGL